MTATVLSFLVFLAAFAAIGTLSIRRRRSKVDDYLLASRSVSPWLVGLSSVVTNNSGYMFIGLIGFTYAEGLSAVWLTVGWITGDLVAWYTVHPRLRAASQTSPAETVGALIAETVRDRPRVVAVALALLTVAFLATYAAAQLNAGSKALHVMFDWNIEAGAVLGAGIVLLYCFAGGIRASIWTDAAQAFVMMAAMIALAGLSLLEIGGLDTLWRSLAAIDPQLVNIVPRDLRFGFALYLAGWFAAGLGAIGQPHILVRTMALEDATRIRVTRRIYFGWYIPFAVAAVLVALSARVLMPDVGQFDAELALPSLAQEMMPGVLVGLVLAGIFAATISTADSQLLTSAAAITQDLLPGVGQSYWKVKAGTAGVTLLVLLVVLAAPSSVFALVILAWSGLAAGIGPLLLVRLYGRPVSAATALAMMTAGVGTVTVWSLVLDWTLDVYEVLPGMAAGLAVYAVARPIERRLAAAKPAADADTGARASGAPPE